MCSKKILFFLLFSVLSLAVWSQEQSDTSPLWDQAFQELDNLDQNSQQLQNIIQELQKDSAEQKQLLSVAQDQSKSLEISLQSSKKWNKILKISLYVAVPIIICETSYILFFKK